VGTRALLRSSANFLLQRGEKIVGSEPKFQPECVGGQVIYTSLIQDCPLRHSQQARREYMQPSKLLYTTRTLPPPHALGRS
jgi:hypothetical protein